MVELYKDHSAQEVADILGFHRSTVLKHLRDEGVEIRPPCRHRESDIKEAEAKKLLRLGRSFHRVSKECRLTRRTVRRLYIEVLMEALEGDKDKVKS